MRGKSEEMAFQLVERRRDNVVGRAIECERAETRIAWIFDKGPKELDDDAVIHNAEDQCQFSRAFVKLTSPVAQTY